MAKRRKGREPLAQLKELVKALARRDAIAEYKKAREVQQNTPDDVAEWPIKPPSK